MLSRIADSLFWLARYMERAEDTARILDVNYHMLLEQSAAPYRLRWDPLIIMAGEQERFFQFYTEANAQTVYEFLAFRSDNPNSIVQCITKARENARTIRDRISREMWEDINGLYHSVTRFDPAELIRAVAEHRISHLLIVPTMINMVVHHPDIEKFDMSCLQRLLYGASPMPEAVMKRALQVLPGVRFTQAYGQSEASPVMTLMDHRYHCFEGPYAGKTRSAGGQREKPPLRSGDHCIGVRTPSRSPRWMLSPMPISSP